MKKQMPRYLDVGSIEEPHLHTMFAAKLLMQTSFLGGNVCSP